MKITWSSWASWTGCTTTCGLGVRLRQRFCLGNRFQASPSASCGEVGKEYKPCKGEPCPPGSLDFRSTQCSHLATSLPFPENLHRWRAIYDVNIGSDPCSLFCKTEDRQPPLVRHLSTTVIDGTPCTGPLQSLCVEAKCIPLGCDGNLNSTVVNDICGVCAGDGTTCEFKKGHYIKTEQKGLHFILSLPKGSANLRLTIKSSKDSYLVLQSQDGGLIFSGISHQFSPMGEEHRVGRQTFSYRRGTGDEPPTISSSERTSEVVDILVFVKESNDSVRIDYEYYIPLKSTESEPESSVKPIHPFLVAAQKERERELGSNPSESETPEVIQLHEDVTWDKNNGEAFSIDFEYDTDEVVDLTPDVQTEVALVSSDVLPSGQNLTSKETERRGNDSVSLTPQTTNSSEQEQQFTYTWKTVGATHCSATCTPGVYYPYAQCYRNDGQIVNESFCDQVQKPEPKPDLCSGRLCNARWVTGMWSQCSVSCGEGRQKRSVRCWRVLAPGFDSTVRDYMCSELPRPPSQRKCTHRACGPSWQTSTWSQCSVPCGTGVQRRQVRCSSTTERCPETARPPDSQPCYSQPCFSVWITGEWSECSGLCGEGVRRRSVVCRNPGTSDEDDLLCGGSRKPLTRAPCTTGDEDECQPTWVPQEWNKCSKSCGEGNTTREVLCIGVKNKRVRIYKDRRCRNIPKPQSWNYCQDRPCEPQWFASSWSQCSVTCGVGHRLREVHCYRENTSDIGCDLNQKPPTQEGCQMESCPNLENIDTASACVDFPNAKCNIVQRAGMCEHWYYKKACCKTCTTI